ncbi:phosphatidate cytidylyltransferase [Lacticigenium naphthae]|uniref:phosphatidate cytidylyltransferase n=1 Tax=Lacticigenium naphthae TaxID=515351 RepID=UPI00041C89C9|nr:phosphatidate cytidylyltransferase [Lacticigenium naphthae]
MSKRIITTIVALMFFIPVVLAGSWILELVLAAIAIIALSELHKMKGIGLFSSESIFAYLGTGLIVFSNRVNPILEKHFTNIQNIDIIFGVILVLLIATVFSKNEYNFDDAAVSVLGMIYIGVGFLSFVEVRSIDIHLLMLILLVVWSTDSGAYLIGSKFGKRKLAPTISPNKSIEGSIGGTASALIVALLYTSFYSFNTSPVIMLLFMGLLSIAGQLGDLIESALKRHFNVKDSGKLLPGHGGMLDRFDSLIFVMTLAQIINIS